MKKLTTTLIFFFVGFQVFGQSFAPLGAKWTYLDVVSSNLPCINSDIYHYEVTHQVVVKGKTLNVLTGPHSEFLYYEEDKKVYFYEADTFHLLIDFNLTVGDTMYHRIPENVYDFHTNCYCGAAHIGDAVSVVWWDTIVTNYDMPLKYLSFGIIEMDESNEFDYNPIFFYTERLGGGGIYTFSPLIYPYDVCHTGECCNPELLCYTDKDFTHDFSSKSENCVYTSIIETEIKQNLSIYPNPTTQTLHIQSQSAQHLIRQVNIIDISGRTLITKEYPDASGIDVSTLPQGLYFWQVVMKNGELVRGKFVKR